jgi:hypothetical protein
LGAFLGTDGRAVSKYQMPTVEVIGQEQLVIEANPDAAEYGEDGNYGR